MWLSLGSNGLDLFIRLVTATKMKAPTESLRSSQSFLCDWKVNKGNLKCQFVLFSYRLVHFLWNSGFVYRVLGFPFFVIHRVCIEWLLGIELGWHVSVGPRLRLFHGVGLVVHPSTKIGSDCVIRHATTFGVKFSGGPAPCLGNFVDVGCGSIILGGVKLGDHSSVGAGSLVLHDVPENVTVVGNPAKPLAKK